MDVGRDRTTGQAIEPVACAIILLARRNCIAQKMHPEYMVSRRKQGNHSVIQHINRRANRAIPEYNGGLHIFHRI